MASQSERWVRRCLRSLQKKGLIEVHYRRDGQAQDTNFYTINPDRILMQAGKRAKTKLKSGGTEFRGVGQSLPGEGEELTSSKQRALDKEQKQDNKQQNNTAKEHSKPTCQEEEIPDYENPYPDEEAVAIMDDGGILPDPPSDLWEGDLDHVLESQPEDIDPCQEEPEVISSESNNPTHPHPPNSAAPPSPSLPITGNENVAPEALTPEKAFNKAIKMSAHPRKREEQILLEWWTAECQRHGTENVLKAFEYFLKTYPHIAAAYGGTIWNFSCMGSGVEGIIKEMPQGNANATKAA
jgi:DNA-binding PadR family transcriptional regulator